VAERVLPVGPIPGPGKIIQHSQSGQGWFWCSLLEMRPAALIGGFPSQEEAEKDARATLGIQSHSTVPA
jgi:hypothetical protein